MTPHPADTPDVRREQDAARHVNYAIHRTEGDCACSACEARVARPVADGEIDDRHREAIRPPERVVHPRQPFYHGRGPSYTAAVLWIAREDEPGELEPHGILRESGVAVALVADVYGRFDQQVAEDVARVRRSEQG